MKTGQQSSIFVFVSSQKIYVLVHIAGEIERKIAASADTKPADFLAAVWQWSSFVWIRPVVEATVWCALEVNTLRPGLFGR